MGMTTGHEHWRTKLEEAGRLKEKGNEFFKEAEYSASAKEYLEAMQVLWTAADELSKLLTSTTVTPEEAVHLSRVQVDVDSLRVSLLLNQALVALKTEDFLAVIVHCSQVLAFQPANVKALFRRGVAKVRLGRTDEAKEDLQKVVLLDPMNRDAKKELQQLAQTARGHGHSVREVSSYLSLCVNGIFGFCIGTDPKRKKKSTIELANGRPCSADRPLH